MVESGKKEDLWSTASYYELLEVQPTASLIEIKTGYKRLAA
jgi:curved DNA-binding protein CbpA